MKSGGALTEWLFTVPDGRRSSWAIIKWWEVRRIPYNLIVGSVGVCSLLLFFFFITHSGELKAGEDAEEPLAIIAAPFLMNFAYTAGWVLEVFLNTFSPEGTGRTGPMLLKLGMAFSLLAALTPSILWGFFWLMHLATRH